MRVVLLILALLLTGTAAAAAASAAALPLQSVSLADFADPSTPIKTSVATVLAPSGALQIPSVLFSGAGSFFTDAVVPVSGFSLTVNLNISQSSPSPSSPPGKDGLAVVLNAGSLLYAQYGAGMGYASLDPEGSAGLPYSLAIEVDTFTDTEMDDPPSPHISIHSMGPLPNSAKEGAPAALCDPAVSLPNMFNPDGITLRIEYESPKAWDPPGTLPALSVYFEPIPVPVIECSAYNLQDLFAPFGRAAKIGVTGSSGVDGGNTQSVLSLDYTSHAAPQGNVSLAQGPGLAGTVAGETARLNVSLLDQYGFAYPYDDVDVQVILDPPPTAGGFVRVVHAGLGVYNVSYATTYAGPHLLALTVNGANIASSPYLVEVQPAQLDPGKSFYFPAPTDAQVGVAIPITFQTVDVYGNNRTTEPALQINPVATPADFHPMLDLAYTGNGAMTGTLFYTLAGSPFTLAFAMDGTLLAGGAVSTFGVEPGAVDANATRVAGPGLAGTVAGTAGTVVVQLFDAYNNHLTSEVPSVVGTVVSPNGADMDVTMSPSLNGNVTLTYTSTVAASYLVEVTVNGAVIPSSPLTLVVSPTNVPDLTTSQVFGTGVAPSGAVAGTELAVDVVVRDEYSNVIDPSVVSVLVNVSDGVQVTGPSPVNGTTLAFAWTATVAITYAVDVRVNGVSFPGSPYGVSVVPAAASAPSSSIALDPTAGAHVAGTLGNVTLVLRDTYGNAITPSNAGPAFNATAALSANATLGSLPPVALAAFSYSDTASGWVSTYNLTTAGAYDVWVLVEGAVVDPSVSPLVVQVVSGPASPGASSVVGAGIDAGALTGAEQFVVNVVDTYGNPVSGVPAASVGLKVAIKWDARVDVPYQLASPISPFVVHYTPVNVSAPYTIEISLYGAPVAGSPFQVFAVPGPAAGPTSRARARGAVGFGAHEVIALDAHDAYGNDLTGASVSRVDNNVTLVLSGPVWSSQPMHPGPDGVFTTAVHFTTHGSYNVLVLVNGANAANSPFRLYVHRSKSRTAGIVLGVLASLLVVAVVAGVAGKLWLDRVSTGSSSKQASDATALLSPSDQGYGSAAAPGEPASAAAAGGAS